MDRRKLVQVFGLVLVALGIFSTYDLLVSPGARIGGPILRPFFGFGLFILAIGGLLVWIPTTVHQNSGPETKPLHTVSFSFLFLMVLAAGSASASFPFLWILGFPLAFVGAVGFGVTVIRVLDPLLFLGRRQ